MVELNRGHHKHSKKFIILIAFLFVLLGILELTTYYTGFLNRIVGITLTLILFTLFFDNYFHYIHNKKKENKFLLLSIMFLIMALNHVSREIFGPLQCKLPTIFSVYFYEGLAILFGAYLIYSANTF
jgi:hypothetical protein